MTITFYANNSEEIVVNKDITQKAVLTGSLKNGADMLNPLILFSDLDSSILEESNYAYIEEFNRYYYITGISNYRDNLWYISFHVDVLMTYKDAIKEQTAVIARQENKWNLYLNDPKFRVYQNPYIVTKAFPDGFTTQKFVLTIAGG